MKGELAGRRILIVEDEYFIAADLKAMLAETGALVIGPVSDPATGLVLAHEAAIDAAVIDVNLCGEPSFAIADALAARGVACLLVTGYDEWALPERYRTLPRLTKPVHMEVVIVAIANLLR
ncbi:MAG: response regulator [Sphingomonas fennica]